jgi:hypothetical protein
MLFPRDPARYTMFEVFGMKYHRRSFSTVFPIALAFISAACDAGGGGAEDAALDHPDSTPGIDAWVGTDGGAYEDSGGLDAGFIGDVTYYEDVRPVLARHCVPCHVAGGAGPFPLDTYETAAPLATRIMQVTRDRIMPPWPADNSGDCHTFRDARWLDDQELALLASWDAQREPMGDPATPRPVVPPLPTLDPPTSMIQTPVYSPGTAGNDDYRCFVVPGVSATDTYLTGHQVEPGNAAMVHHVIVYAPNDAAAATAAQSRDHGTGYPCFGGPGVDASPVVIWAPGSGATRYPEGTGVRLRGGAPFIIQVHYNLLANRGSDQTRIRLATNRSATNALIWSLADYGLSLPPRMADVSTSYTQDLSSVLGGANLPITIYGHFPHMHTLGTEIRIDHRIPSGAEQCLVDIPRWNFNWQMVYFYETPVTISSLDALRITCSYDTRSQTSQVSWGEGTEDEMCINFFYVVVGGS